MALLSPSRPISSASPSPQLPRHSRSLPRAALRDSSSLSLPPLLSRTGTPLTALPPRKGLDKAALARSSRNFAGISAAVAVTEPATGVTFPASLVPPGIFTELTLLGSGVREKKFAIIAVKVYAVGLYSGEVASAAAAAAGQTAEELISNQSFFDNLANAPVDKALVLTLVRDVTAQQFIAALSEELTPKLQQQGADVAVIGDLAAVFEGRKLSKNSAVLLTWGQPSSLHVAFVDNVGDAGGYNSSSSPVTINSLPLLKALFDIYLGKDPIAPSLKSSIAASVIART